MRVKHLLLIIWIGLLIWSGFYVDFKSGDFLCIFWEVIALITGALFVLKIVINYTEGKYDNFLNKKL